MAAHEHEFETLVGKRRRIDVGHRRLRCPEQPGLGGEQPLPAQPVDGSAACRRHQPGGGVGRHAVPGPPLHRGGERVLNGILGEVEVAEETDQRGKYPAPVVAEDLFDQAYISKIGRTSTEPPWRTAGIRDATSIARSRSSASRR